GGFELSIERGKGYILACGQFKIGGVIDRQCISTRQSDDLKAIMVVKEGGVEGLHDSDGLLGLPLANTTPAFVHDERVSELVPEDPWRKHLLCIGHGKGFPR